MSSGVSSRSASISPLGDGLLAALRADRAAPAAGPGSPSTVAVIKNGGMPMSRSRVIVLGASLVCSVLNTSVAGERGLHGDLGRFQVANLADQDLVGVLPQDGPQAVGERVADRGVDRHLDDAVDVVLDRVFGGDQLVFDARSAR